MTPNLTKSDLEAAAVEFFGGSVKILPLASLYRLITISQFCTDTILNEIEGRDELTFSEFDPNIVVVPYHSDHMIPTILTRDDSDA